MDFVFEIIFEGLIEGLFGAAKSKKVPLIIRLLIVTVIFCLIIAVGVLAGISALKATGVVGAIICWAVALMFILLWLCVLGLLKIDRDFVVVER